MSIFQTNLACASPKLILYHLTINIKYIQHFLSTVMLNVQHTQCQRTRIFFCLVHMTCGNKRRSVLNPKQTCSSILALWVRTLDRKVDIRSTKAILNQRTKPNKRTCSFVGLWLCSQLHISEGFISEGFSLPDVQLRTELTPNSLQDLWVVWSQHHNLSACHALLTTFWSRWGGKRLCTTWPLAVVPFLFPPCCSSICEHVQSGCKQCGGSSIWEHDREWITWKNHVQVMRQLKHM
jgi:hypothetical protein